MMKATERVGEYKWDRISSGYYALYTSTTNSYSVSASDILEISPIIW